MYNRAASPVVTDCTFDTNEASYSGGGIGNGWYSRPTVTNCIFIANKGASGGGGGMANDTASPTLTNCLFSANTVAGGGGGVYNQYAAPTMTNCTFSANKAAWGGAIENGQSASSTLTNCILWGNSAWASNNEIYNYDDVTSPATAVLTYSCIAGGYAGAGNISTDPLFVDAASGDCRLSTGSPCINAGTSTGAPGTDILGVARPHGGGYDMGAYEYSGK